MANAILFDHQIPINRTQLIPTQSDEFSATWVNKIAEQQVRAVGIGGSYVFDVPESPNVDYYVSTPFIQIPNWFGTVVPPMVYCMPQYGSVIVYKQFQDSLNRQLTNRESPKFRTYVQSLYYDVNVERWKFRVNHEVRIPFWPGDPQAFWRILGFRNAWWPDITDPAGNTGIPRPAKAVLHWYVCGVDPNQ